MLGGSNAYPYQLERILNRQATGIRFSVVNKGLGGDNTADILSDLEEKLDRYKPDMIIAMMGINDGGQHMRYKETPGSGRLFLRYFRTYKLARIAWMHIMAMVKGAAGPRAFLSPKECYAESPGSMSDYNRYVEAGRLYIKKDDYAGAEDMFEKALELDPADPGLYMELEICYNKQGKFSDAERMFTKAIEIDPGNYSIYIGLGVFYRDQGNLEEAKNILNRAIGLEPDCPDAYIELAWCYKDNTADELLKKAIELDTLNYDTYISSGMLYKYHNNYIKAESMFKKAVALDPDNEQGHIWLAVLYSQTGKDDLAARYYKAAHQLRDEYYNSMTYRNYQELKSIVDRRGIKLVCVQYPMRSIEPLKRIFEYQDGIIFVDNEKIFKDAVGRDGYGVYFGDSFAGDFGHCTPEGNRLLAENIAFVLLKEYFNK